MGDDEREGPSAQPPEEPRLIIPAAAGHMVRKASRFSREAVATMISLATAAFGFVAALAWNTAITETFKHFFGEAARLSAYFIYAVIVTIIGVVVIVILSRLATRIDAEPIEFKYPGTPRS